MTGQLWTAAGGWREGRRWSCRRRTVVRRRLRVGTARRLLRVEAARKWLHLWSMRVGASRWATVGAAHQGCASGACTLGLRARAARGGLGVTIFPDDTIFSGDLSFVASPVSMVKSASLQFFHLPPPEKVLQSYRKNSIPLTLPSAIKISPNSPATTPKSPTNTLPASPPPPPE
ncbi:hypothetical protein C2S53_020876 [Perilla frutescens var. hirtella]|uniref:Uncharacterized protein n=1 Tax=Perilla frutescens var. hirtella TaxID=608512 RepID=A0AAD4IR19_PERFH|nr:hypothetical protein C2S53_020876 [Perilla frutescens var. hirtella]